MNAGPVPTDIVSLADYERHARARIVEPIWAYVAGAGADGLTRRWNRDAFDALRLEGRVLVDMTGAHTRLTLFGLEMTSPIILAPVALQKLVHPDGELATVMGAGATGTVMTVSTQASLPLEQVAAAAAAPLWFQLYIQMRREDTLRLLRRAETAGYRAIVVTVDAAVNGVRNEEQRAGFRLPPDIQASNLAGMPQPQSRAGPGQSPVFTGLLHHAPTWKDVAWLRGQTTLPLLLKGITAPRDAVRAVEAGADGIIVSNHGGRVLDTLPASIDSLQRIAGHLGPDGVPLLVDGGVRRGTDIVKALALGAKAVLIGRPILHGLSVAGPVGVAHVIAILRAELEAAMALTGRPTLADIDRSVLWD